MAGPEYWLRKVDLATGRGTSIVVQWTKAQAAKKDMVPISKEDAMKVIATKEANDRARAANIKLDGHVLSEVDRQAAEAELVAATTAKKEIGPEVNPALVPEPTPEEVAVKALVDMDADELTAYAEEKKIYIHPACSKAETILEKIQEAEAEYSDPE